MTLAEQIVVQAEPLPEAERQAMEQQALEQEMDEIIRANLETLQALAE